MNNRLPSIDAEMARELSRLIPTLKDPRITGVVSIVRVETSRDLSLSKVHVSAMDDLSGNTAVPADAKNVCKGLASASGYLRRELGRTLGLRHTPELKFIPDYSIREGARILSMLEKVKDEGQTDV